jgi:hypothetical protein
MRVARPEAARHPRKDALRKVARDRVRGQTNGDAKIGIAGPSRVNGIRRIVRRRTPDTAE